MRIGLDMSRLGHRPSRALWAVPRAGFSSIDPRMSPTRLPEEPDVVRCGEMTPTTPGEVRRLAVGARVNDGRPGEDARRRE
jgi:hypothetical protein